VNTCESATYRLPIPDGEHGIGQSVPQLTDLTTMPLDGGQTPQSLGWTLMAAVAINDAGVIIGYGTQSGSSKAWILYPNCQE